MWLTSILTSWCWELVSLQMLCPQGFVSVLPRWSQASTKAGDLRNQGGSYASRTSLGNHMPSCPPCSAGHTGQLTFNVQRDSTRAWIPEVWILGGHLGGWLPHFSAETAVFSHYPEQRGSVLCLNGQRYAQTGPLFQNCDGSSLTTEHSTNTWAWNYQLTKILSLTFFSPFIFHYYFY